MWHDLSEFSLPSPEFARTTNYVEFYRRMRQVAAAVARLLNTVPPWEDGWPIQMPQPQVPPAFQLPRL